MSNPRPFFRDIDRAKANNPDWEKLRDTQKMDLIAKAAAEREEEERDNE